MRLLTAALVAALCAASPALAETASEALTAFGLIGTWSPDCSGSYRIVFAAPSGAAPTVHVYQKAQVIAASEIREAKRTDDGMIKWTSVIKSFSVPDHPPESWMPQPQEIWETVILKAAARMVPVSSQRADGQKIQVKDGFIYTGEPANPGAPPMWRSTGTATLPLERCGTGNGAQWRRPGYIRRAPSAADNSAGPV